MHLLVFEPRLEGHHLSWLQYIAEDFLAAGHRLTLGIDYREHTVPVYREQLGDLLKRVSILSVFDENGRPKEGSRIRALAQCLAQSGADHAFINNLDDIASTMLRGASVWIYPPHILKGKLSGVYFRPRFLDNAFSPLGNIPKMIGFRRLAAGGWFHRIFLVDEYLQRRHAARFAPAGLTFLPDTWSGSFSIPKAEARRSLGIDPRHFVFLHYGIGTRRKGLHLLTRAIDLHHPPAHWHLLCAGRIAEDREINEGIRRLESSGRVTVLDRYVSKAEEELCFQSADVVLLPYIRHFGSSGVLALAAGAGKMVIASDEGLIARRVRERGLGICFASGNPDALMSALKTAEETLEKDPEGHVAAAHAFATQCNRMAFREALTSIYPINHSEERM